MKQSLITLLAVAALTLAQMPARGDEKQVSVATHATTGTATFIKKGTKLTPSASEALETKMAQSVPTISRERAGAEASTEVAILATIGALVVLGAIIYAVNKNNQKE